jgi:hypothetical protein
MATGPSPTILTTYPFQSQSIPNLTNSLLIPVGMYVYFITYPLPLIFSHPHWWLLSKTVMWCYFYCVFTYIYSLLLRKTQYVIVEMY